jgi:2-iminobutanoate/2-iminopropanoate deaminase
MALGIPSLERLKINRKADCHEKIKNAPSRGPAIAKGQVISELPGREEKEKRDRRADQNSVRRDDSHVIHHRLDGFAPATTSLLFASSKRLMYDFPVQSFGGNLMDREPISTDKAPKAIGPYAQAIKASGVIYTAGQIAIDPTSGNVVEGGIGPQTRQVLENLSAVLKAAGSSLDRIVKATVFLKNMSDFAAMNEVYAEYLSNAQPARSTVAVAELPRGALVEIDLIALA